MRITPETVANARADIVRLNNQLRELHLEAERCQLKKARLESERTRVQSFIELCELAQRFGTPALPSQSVPVVQIVPVDVTQPNGVKLVTVAVSKEPPTRHKRKPDNIPPMPEMIAAALRDGIELAPVAIADFIRKRWWPDVRSVDVNSSVWRLAQIGRLYKSGSRYRLNGHGNGAA
jgi:hypothetical protein